MYVCVCHAITDSDIRSAAGKGVSSLEALGDELRLGTCCGRCKECANKVLQQSLMESCGTGHCKLGSAA
ncbi:MAG: (2Fe-2S)-binding protein [gamma proteobacterium symbiont of Ctena orbiculata]|nr:(2Fe-2S)-binding protein [Candidatus Thiodiazotropha taylori]MBT3059703.1 (2Fe-2S)-binding protein [Candidatus Thiodiazotropha sp. (ex Lucina pensylvanica)]MBV2095824.1 (2Fe-2S)-binding protein [Candidatus Thiodiazotropha sp. (ex Codakia orbicularis)]PUB74607.1 MAG: (2Fe-2S)-binding protein [gamma proteobacterium symbiont of Ctena orbiculata]MBT3063949.1 (2Fe-2S)-binding protein [Candidatus Thiodiazotropha sp. (ex Lucina pensylvanica)]